MPVRKMFFTLLRLFIASSLLYYLLIIKIPLSEVIAALTAAKVNYIVTTCILSIVIQFVLTYRLKLLTDKQGMSLSFLQLFDINLAAVFYGLFLPGGNLAGGAIRFYKLSKPANKRAQALASIIFDRVVATAALCTTGIMFWLADFSLHADYIALTMILIILALLIFCILLFDRRALLTLEKFLEWINLPIFSKKVNKIAVSFSEYRNLSPSALANILVLSIIAQLLGILIYYLLAKSLGINITFITMGWIRSAVIVITMIPISVSGLGVREGTFFFLLKTYGISGEKALALSFLVFSITLLFIGLIGGSLEGKKLFSPSDSKEKFDEA
jgi:hypothetical protein